MNDSIFFKPKTNYFDSAGTSLKTKDFISIFSNSITNRNNFSIENIKNLIKQISKFLNTKPENISLVYNATTAINLIAERLLKEKKEYSSIYISEYEHLCNVFPWINLSKKKINFFNQKNIQEIYELKNSIISFSSLTNLEGKKIEINKNIFLKNNTIIIDATQMIQHQKIDLSNLKADFLFFSAHKFFGPFGIGIIYSKNKNIKFGVNIDNLNKKNKYTLDWNGINAWNKCFFQIEKIFENRINQQKEKNLVEYFLKNFPKNEFIEIFDSEIKNNETNYPIFLLKTKMISAHDFLFAFENQNFHFRSGLSCSFNPNLKKFEKNLIRLSFLFYNDVSEIKLLFKKIKTIKINNFF